MMNHANLGSICETCVDESKSHITSEDAVEQIRKYLSNIYSDERYDEQFEIGLKRELLKKDHRIKVLERALELACWDFEDCSPYGNDATKEKVNEDIQHYIQQAEEELKEESHVED